MLIGINSKCPTCDIKNEHHLENLGQSHPIIFVCLAQAQMHICVKYQASMVNHKGNPGTQRKTHTHTHTHKKNRSDGPVLI